MGGRFLKILKKLECFGGMLKVVVVVVDPVQLVLGGIGRIEFVGRACWVAGCRG